jgi:hypothetical protein
MKFIEFTDPHGDWAPGMNFGSELGHSGVHGVSSKTYLSGAPHLARRRSSLIIVRATRRSCDGETPMVRAADARAPG